MLAARTGQFRHIVFADALNGARRAINYSPAAPETSGGGALDGEEADFIHRVFRRLGLNADDYRSESLQRRLPACLRALGVNCVAAARALLDRHPHAVQVAGRAVLIGVTSFFRDAAVFDSLRNQALPTLCSTRPSLRVLSVGCSDGAELYSVAMLLAESGNLARASLCGTDVRADAILYARRACYDGEAIRAVPESMRQKYFVLDRSAGRWRLSGEIVHRVQWRVADMLTMCEPGPWDLILCRNVAMYLRPQVLGGLWTRLADSLSPGGFVVLGKAERPIGAPRLKSIGAYVYQRNG